MAQGQDRSPRPEKFSCKEPSIAKDAAYWYVIDYTKEKANEFHWRTTTQHCVIDHEVHATSHVGRAEDDLKEALILATCVWYDAALKPRLHGTKRPA